MSAKRVESFEVTLWAVLFMLPGSQQPCVVGRHPNTWDSTCLGVHAVIWCSAKWLSTSPGTLVQPACTLPASSAGTWAGQASVPLVCVSRVTLKCRWGLCMNACPGLAPVQNPLTWSSVPLEELLRDCSNVLSFLQVAQAVVLKCVLFLLIRLCQGG